MHEGCSHCVDLDSVQSTHGFVLSGFVLSLHQLDKTLVLADGMSVRCVCVFVCVSLILTQI